MTDKATAKVIGLSFDIESGAVPTVVLKTAGADAAAILQAAERTDVPIVRDPALVQTLYRVPMDAPVSRELFPVMAALIAHVLSVDGGKRGGNAQ
jgi:type III secretion system FlhB-like substrate exporter